MSVWLPLRNLLIKKEHLYHVWHSSGMSNIFSTFDASSTKIPDSWDVSNLKSNNIVYSTILNLALYEQKGWNIYYYFIKIFSLLTHLSLPVDFFHPLSLSLSLLSPPLLSPLLAAAFAASLSMPRFRPCHVFLR